MYIKLLGITNVAFVRHNRSTTDQIFCIRQMMEKNRSIMGQYISSL